MNILISVFTFPPEANGVAHVAYNHSMSFLKRGHKVTVATSVNAQRASYEFPIGLEVIEFDVRGNANPRTRYSGEIAQYQDFIAASKVDIMFFHCWQIWTTDLAIPLLSGRRAKAVLVSHGFNANSRPVSIRSLINWFTWQPYVHRLPRMMRSFDHIVHLTSIANREAFYDRTIGKNIEYQNYSIIPNGCDINASDKNNLNFRSIYEIQERHLILYVAAYSEGKNQKAGLEAFLASDCDDAILVFIGNSKTKYSSEIEEAYQLYRKEGGAKRVMFLETVERKVIEAAYHAADLFICPSRGEAQPLVILDAMASGTPFISFDIGCVREFPGGIIVRSSVEMSTAISTLLGDEIAREELSKAGKSASDITYSWDKIADQYDLLLTKLCSPRGNKL